jgi:TPR repeat protein
MVGKYTDIDINFGVTMNKNLRSEQDEKFKTALEYNKNFQYEKYIEIIKKLADEGHHPSEMHLGIAYASGFESIEKDYRQSLKWHLKAIKGNDPVNFYWLYMLYEPNCILVESDDFVFSIKNTVIAQDYYIKAINGFKKQADAGDVIAMYRLGEISQSKAESKYWLDKWRAATGQPCN